MKKLFLAVLFFMVTTGTPFSLFSATFASASLKQPNKTARIKCPSWGSYKIKSFDYEGQSWVGLINEDHQAVQTMMRPSEPSWIVEGEKSLVKYAIHKLHNEPAPIVGGEKPLVEYANYRLYNVMDLMPPKPIEVRGYLKRVLVTSAFFEYFCKWNHNLLNGCSINLTVKGTDSEGSNSEHNVDLQCLPDGSVYIDGLYF